MTDKDILSLPPCARDFLMYLLTIKNKSGNTVKEYFYDIRLFLKYIHLKNTHPAKLFKISADDLADTSIQDMPFDEIKNITLSDLYACMS